MVCPYYGFAWSGSWHTNKNPRIRVSRQYIICELWGNECHPRRQCNLHKNINYQLKCRLRRFWDHTITSQVLFFAKTCAENIVCHPRGSGVLSFVAVRPSAPTDRQPLMIEKISTQSTSISCCRETMMLWVVRCPITRLHYRTVYVYSFIRSIAGEKERNTVLPL